MARSRLRWFGRVARFAPALFLFLLPPGCGTAPELRLPAAAGEAYLGNAGAGWELRVLPGTAPGRVLLEARRLGPEAFSGPGRPERPRPLGGADLMSGDEVRPFRATAAGTFQLEVARAGLAGPAGAVVRLRERGGGYAWSVALRPLAEE